MSFLAYELWAASACITQTYLISQETHGPWQPTHKEEETTHTGNTKQQNTHTQKKSAAPPHLNRCLRYETQDQCDNHLWAHYIVRYRVRNTILYFLSWRFYTLRCSSLISFIASEINTKTQLSRGHKQFVTPGQLTRHSHISACTIILFKYDGKFLRDNTNVVHVGICQNINNIEWYYIDTLCSEYLAIFMRISNHMHSKVRNENTYPFPSVNGRCVEYWEWISNFIPHFIMDVITYPCWDSNQSM